MDFLTHSCALFYNTLNLAKRRSLRKAGEAPVTSAASAHSSAEEWQVDRSSPPPEERRMDGMEEERFASPLRQPTPPMEQKEAMEEERAEEARTDAGADEPDSTVPFGVGGKAGADEPLPEA